MEEGKKVLTDFFALNDTPDTSPPTQWEAHKCVIRGKLIALTTAQKKTSQKATSDLLTKIKDLETRH